MALDTLQENTYVLTGFKELDKVTGGFRKGNLYLIGGRPSQGKTSFAITLLKKCCMERAGHAVFVSLEFSAENLQKRMHFNNPSRIHIQACPQLCVREIESFADKISKSLQGQGKHLDLIVIDYLQLLCVSDTRKDRPQAMKDILVELDSLAKKLNVAIVVFSQLNRSNKDISDLEDAPILTDFRELSEDLLKLFLWVVLLHFPTISKSTGFSTEKGYLILMQLSSNYQGQIELQFNRTSLLFEEMG